MTKEERDAVIESARKTPWLDTMKRRETEALLEALDEATRQRDEAREAADQYRFDRDYHCKRADVATLDRDEARAQLAALHAAASDLRRCYVRRYYGRASDGVVERLDRTLADLATAAAEHERSVRADERAKALREAVRRTDAALEEDSDEIAQDVLANMAAEAERGTR